MLTRFLRNYFLPTEDNRGTPWGASWYALFCYLVFVVGVTFSPIYLPRLPFASLVEPLILFSSSDIVDLVNHSRKAMGVPVLQENILLTRAAEAKARDMFTHQYFAHTSPQNIEPWFFFKEARYNYLAAGENLAIDFFSASSAHDALMRSPTHRANILNPAFREVGISVLADDFGGHTSVIVVQHFGTPAKDDTKPNSVLGASQARISENKMPPSAPKTLKSKLSSSRESELDAKSPLEVRAVGGVEDLSRKAFEVNSPAVDVVALPRVLEARTSLLPSPLFVWLRMVLLIAILSSILPFVLTYLKRNTMPKVVFVKIFLLFFILGSAVFWGPPQQFPGAKIDRDAAYILQSIR